MFTSTGRKKDSVWSFFSEKKPTESSKTTRAKCLHCGVELVGLVKRMKEHHEKCQKKSNFDSDKAIEGTGHTEESSSKKRRPGSLSSAQDEEQADISEEEEDGHDIGLQGGKTPSMLLSSAASTSSEMMIEDTPLTEHSRKNSRLSSSNTGDLSKFIVRTTAFEKKKFDDQVARMVFATNSKFMITEHPEFIKMINLLRPGYKPPHRKRIGGELLEEVSKSVTLAIKTELRGKDVCMSIDGWSNVHNEPIVGVAVHDAETKHSYLVDTIDTQDNSHTSEYLLKLALDSINKCKTFGCNVKSFVTDNASNMAKMRRELAKASSDHGNELDIITYGCSAHLLHLFAHDIEDKQIKNDVKTILKYFRNHHIPASKYKKEGGRELVLPIDVRWNSLCDSLHSYISNWHILSKVCTDNRLLIDPDISKKIYDVSLRQKTEEYLKKLREVAIAIDRMQREDCSIAEATKIWIELVDYFLDNGTESEVQQLRKRRDSALTEPHFLAYMLHPKFRGDKLDQKEIDLAMEYVSAWHSGAMGDILRFRAKTGPFKGYMFQSSAVDDVSPLTWWKSLSEPKLISEELNILVKQLFSAVASSASLERIFSTFGVVHTKLRNRLGVQKASALVTIFKYLNGHSENEHLAKE